MDTPVNKLQEIRKALEVATPGPWNVGKKSPNGLNNIGHKGLIISQVFGDSDAHLIANAPEWLSYLLTELDTAKQENERLQKHIEMIERKGYV